MLFRPYRAYYLGKWRIPFTPGLIPKRRGELAEQLGKLVVNHLLTAEGLQKKLENKMFVHEMTEWVQREVRKFLQSEETLSDVLASWTGVTRGKEKIQHILANWMCNRSEKIISELRTLPLNEIIPKPLAKKVDDLLPVMTQVFIEKGKEYFNSPEGIERLSNMVDRF
ncbi:DUF445 family protein [Anaerobacillus sp. CMMVII]|nr:DUF445 family protein [Anaerobacillus sp. CMMVII]